MEWVDSYEKANFLSCNLSRKTVESKNISQIAATLAKLTDSVESVNKFKDSLMVTVDGYNDDPRQLWFVSEVRECLGLLDEQFPYWFHFCEKKGEHSKCLPYV